MDFLNRKTIVEVSGPNLPDTKQSVYHKGVVVQQTTTHLRVFNPDKGGDSAQEHSEFFPIDWCRIKGELEKELPRSPFLQY